MNETQTMTNEQLAAALGKHRALSVVFRLLTCAAGLGTILLFSGDSTPLAFACLVLTLVFGYQMGKHGQAVKTLLSDHIISGALRQVLEDVEYTPSRGIPSELVEAAGMVFPFEYNSSRGSDYIRGVYHGRKVALSDITLYQAESFYNEERSAWEERKEKKFQGQWLVCDFGQPFPGEVRLSENDRALRRQHKADGAETEDPAFHARFLVTAASPQEARSLLTPRMMSSILAAADGSGGPVYMAFLRDGRLHVAVRTGRDLLTLGKGKADASDLRQRFLSQLRWFMGIIDAIQPADALCREETDAAAASAAQGSGRNEP